MVITMVMVMLPKRLFLMHRATSPSTEYIGALEETTWAAPK